MLQRPMVAADFIKPGVIYGYRTKGDYGEYSEGQGNVYYFGRSKQKDVLDLACVGEALQEQQCELLKKKCSRSGLNAPSRILRRRAKGKNGGGRRMDPRPFAAIKSELGLGGERIAK